MYRLNSHGQEECGGKRQNPDADPKFPGGFPAAGFPGEFPGKSAAAAKITGNFPGKAFRRTPPVNSPGTRLRSQGISREIPRMRSQFPGKSPVGFPGEFPGKRLPHPKKLAPGGGGNGRFPPFCPGQVTHPRLKTPPITETQPKRPLLTRRPPLLARGTDGAPLMTPWLKRLRIHIKPLNLTSARRQEYLYFRPYLILVSLDAPAPMTFRWEEWIYTFFFLFQRKVHSQTFSDKRYANINKNIRTNGTV